MNIFRDELTVQNAPEGYEEGKAWSSVKSEVKTAIRSSLCKAQHNTCAYCGECFTDESSLTVDHIRPKNIKGSYDYSAECMSNLVMACSACNMIHKNSNDRKNKSLIKDGESDKVKEIVLPYSNPKEFFGCLYGCDDCNAESPILVRPSKKANDDNKKKAENSIEVFKLNSPMRVEKRFCQYLFLKMIRQKQKNADQHEE